MFTKDITNKLQTRETPFYYYDMALLRETIGRVKSAAGEYGYKVHYAMKANFDPRIMEEMKRAGLGVDCVSGGEVKAAIEMGFAPSGVVFAGVGKSDKEIRYALEHDIFSFNCESRHELQVINSIAREMGRKARIALRINPDVDPMTHQYISTGKADNKFGISYTEVDEVITELDSLVNVEIIGLHFHIGSQIREMKVFGNLCERVNMIQEWFRSRGIVLKHINLGGGLGIDYDNPDKELIPDFGKLFDIVHKNLAVPEGVTVHFELGRSIVGQCGSLITRVLYNKQTAGGRNVLIVDAGMTDLIRPALYQAKHAIENLTSTASEKVEYMVVGPVCESSDTFAKAAMLPESHRGDLIALRSAGAYGAAMASRYNLRDIAPGVYSDML